MKHFTPSPWVIAPKVFDDVDTIFSQGGYASPEGKIIAMGIRRRDDAELIVKAPDMYNLLVELLDFFEFESGYGDESFEEYAGKIDELLTQIDGGRNYDKIEDTE